MSLPAAKGACRQYGEAAGAGAQVEHSRGAAAGEKRLAPQLGAVRARHDHALIHAERVAREPRLVQKIGDGHAFADPARGEPLDALDLGSARFPVQLAAEWQPEPP